MILKYKADRRSTAFVLLFLIGQAAIYFHFASLALVPLLALGCAILGGINHNQMHCPAFVSKQANGAWNYILSFGMGASAAQITVTHILVHHRFFRDSRDWSRYELAQGQGIQRLLSYLKNSVIEIARKRKDFLASSANRNWQQRIRREKILLWVLSLALFAASPVAFLLTYLLPWIFGLLLVLIVNLVQHDGLDLSSDHHSRDFIGSLGNWMTFNSFFHTVHHEKPSLHWSLLPSEHKARGLEGEKSFWGYLWTQYFVVSLK